jgi:hypothetical protein
VPSGAESDLPSEQESDNESNFHHFHDTEESAKSGKESLKIPVEKKGNRETPVRTMLN